MVKDVGATLPQELEVFAQTDDDEQRMRLLMEKLALPLELCSQVEYSIFSFPEMLGSDE
jgi:hypothetical protein